MLISRARRWRPHAIKPQTGEILWDYVASKRAINTGVVVGNNLVW